MKKLEKKLSYFIKVLLVLGLIISNLSSLSVVFAYEGEENNPELVNDTLNNETVMDKSLAGFDAKIDDGKITITYGDEINDTDELRVLVSEVYTYHNCEVTDNVSTCDITVNNSYEVSATDRELLSGEGMVINYTSTVLSQAKFDGTYTLEVSLVNVTNDNASLGEKEVENKENTFDSGIQFKVYDESTALVNESNGKYTFTTSQNVIKVLGKMLPGGISPNDVFVYGEKETEYSALEFLDLEFIENIDLNDYLYGEYRLPVDITYMRNGEEITYTKHFTISHGSYEDNAKKLNGLVDLNRFLFEGTTKDGKLYVYLGENEITIDDINEPLYDAYFGTKNIVYTFSNEEVNADTKITITDGITTITYQVIVVGDINDDGVLDENDIVALTDQLVGNEELNLDKANIDDTDNEANTRDVLKLAQIVETGAWKIKINEKEIQLDAQLQNSSEGLVSGDEFDVYYMIMSSQDEINGFAGLVNYDKSLLELVSVSVADNFVGSNKDGKFVYVNLEEKSQSTVSSDAVLELKLLTLKFKALASGSSKITIDDPEYFNHDTYYKIIEIDDETGDSRPSTKIITLDVTVSESSDNSLASLKLGDNEIELADGVYDYTLTVSNNVTKLNVSALTSNVAASITSIVCPEELVEGENTITITVASESGEEAVYTVTVTRENTPEETSNVDNTNNTNNQDYYHDYNNTNNDSVVPNPPAKNDDKEDVEPTPEVKEKSNISKVIIVALILLVIAGLIYLIFKDEDDESKKANKDINKFKKEDFDTPKERTGNNSNKKDQNKNKKKER